MEAAELKPLTYKEKLFGDFFCTNGFIQWRAAESAGYQGSKETLYVRGSENLKKPNVRAYIDTKLDEMTAGFQNSELIIIAGRPSRGKSSLAINIAEHAAIKEKKNIAIFSLEMAAEQIILRLLGSQAKVDISSFDPRIFRICPLLCALRLQRFPLRLGSVLPPVQDQRLPHLQCPSPKVRFF